MGFSTSGAAAVIFVGVLIAIGIAYPTLETANDRRSDAIDDRDQRVLDLRNTAIGIANASYDDGADELTINVTNEGSTTLGVNETDLLVDGEYRTGYDTSVEGIGDRTVWQPGETLTIVVSASERPDRVKVVAENGIADTVTEV